MEKVSVLLIAVLLLVKVILWDLTREEWKGRLLMPNPLESSVQANVIQTILQHPGEMAVMTGLSVAEIQIDRLAIARKYAKEWGHVVVLKGAFTVIAAPNGETFTIPVASPALARAGSGDVLAGLIVGLRAQGLDAVQSAVLGSWIHSQAGLTAGEMIGASASVLAGDILAFVPNVLADLE